MGTGTQAGVTTHIYIFFVCVHISWLAMQPSNYSKSDILAITVVQFLIVLLSAPFRLRDYRPIVNTFTVLQCTKFYASCPVL